MSTNQLTPEMIGMEKISPSALTCYEECPRLFYFQNWLGLKLDEDRLHMDFGDAIHKAIEVIYLKYDNNFKSGWDSASFEPVKEKFLHEWKLHRVPESTFQKYMKTAKGRDSGYTKREDLYKAFRDDGLAILESYWKEKEHLLVEYRHDLVDFEMSAKMVLFNPDNPEEQLPIPVSMRIDARNRNQDKIIDFKTSGSAYNQEESKKKIQGQIYLLQYYCETGKLITDFDYIVLRKNLKSPDRVQVVSLKYDMADLSALFHRINSILWSIAGREFEKPRSGHASYCQCKDYEKALNITE